MLSPFIVLVLAFVLKVNIYKYGEEILVQGQTSKEMFIILEGYCEACYEDVL